MITWRSDHHLLQAIRVGGISGPANPRCHTYYDLESSEIFSAHKICHKSDKLYLVNLIGG